MNFATIWVSECSHNLSFQFWSRFEICVLSHFEFSRYVDIWVFEFCQIFNLEILAHFELSQWEFFLVLSQFNFLSFFTNIFLTLVYLRFLFLSQFWFWSFVILWVLEFRHNRVFEFCNNCSFWVMLQFEIFFFFFKYAFFGFYLNVSFGVLSSLELMSFHLRIIVS